LNGRSVQAIDQAGLAAVGQVFAVESSKKTQGCHYVSAITRRLRIAAGFRFETLLETSIAF